MRLLALAHPTVMIATMTRPHAPSRRQAHSLKKKISTQHNRIKPSILSGTDRRNGDGRYHGMTGDLPFQNNDVTTMLGVTYKLQ